MPKGVADSMLRMRQLLDGTVTPIGRAMATTLKDWTDLSRGDREKVAMEVAPAFVLLHDGSEEDKNSLISAPSLTQYELFTLTVSVYMGAGEGGLSSYGQAQRDLGTIWQDVRNLLEDINNTDRSNTGWWWALDWKRSDMDETNGRLPMEITYKALIEQSVGAL